MSEKRQRRFRRNIRRFLASSALILAGLASAAPGAPEAGIRAASDEVLAAVSRTTERQALRQLAETRIAPHFDFQRMTELAAGPVWRQASPAQKTRLIAEFRDLLIRTYTATLASGETDGARITVKPARKNETDGEILVQTNISLPGRRPLSIDYRMIDAGERWLVIDVLLENVSLVTNYRTWFVSQAREGGIDAVLRALEQKNRQTPA